MSMTRRQAEALTFIRHFMTENGIAPTVEEIKHALQLRSKSGVHRILMGLQERGNITVRPCRARGIELVERDPLVDVLGAQLTAKIECLAMERGVPSRVLVREAAAAYCGVG